MPQRWFIQPCLIPPKRLNPIDDECAADDRCRLRAEDSRAEGYGYGAHVPRSLRFIRCEPAFRPDEQEYLAIFRQARHDLRKRRRLLLFPREDAIRPRYPQRLVEGQDAVDLRDTPAPRLLGGFPGD